VSRSNKSNRLFHELAADLNNARPGSVHSVCCPLCLADFPFEAIAKLSVEHVISSKVQGRTKTLTCRQCNNSQGTRLDRHLVSAMKAIDGLEGTEPIATVWRRPEGRIVANTLLLAGTKAAPITSRIVGPASNSAAIAGIHTKLRHESTINLTLDFDFIPEQYWKAAVRAAYLAVFCAQGYEYVFSEGARQVRSVIDGTTAVNPKIIMEAFPDAEPPRDILVMPHSFSDVGECFAVLLTLKTKRTRYLNVYLPGKPGCDWDVLGTLYKHATRLRIETTPDTWTSPLYIWL
jgi:hypothetical protein